MMLWKKMTAVFILAVILVSGGAGVAYGDYFEPEPTEKPVYNPKISLLNPTVIEMKGGATDTFEIQVKNTGSGSAQNLVVQANISSEAPFSVEFSGKSNTVSSISSGSTKKMNLQIKVDKNAASGSYPISLKYSFKNAYNENFTGEDTIMVRIENTTLGPDLRLYNFVSSKANIAAGDSFQLSADFENISTQTAYDATVTVEGLDTEGIYLDNSTDNAYIKTFAPGTLDNVTFNLRAATKAKKGTYTLKFKVTYKDSGGEAHSKEYTYYVTVGSTSTEDDEKGDIQISNIIAPTATFNVGDEFGISMEVVNTGTATAKNVKISAVTDEAGAIVPKTANIRTIQSLAPGESRSFEFKFSPTSNAKTQNYTIGFNVEYETGEETSEGAPEKASFSQYAGVNVYNPDEEDDEKDTDKISIPKIIVNEYKVDPQIVSAGQEFDLDLSFLNTHQSKTIENVKAYLIMEDKSTSTDTTEDKGNVFSPVNGSNTFYIDRIGPKEETRKHLRMFCIPDASAKTYTITVKFEYQDSEYNTYTEEALIGISVKQVTRLETSEISLNSSAMLEDALPISFQLYNMGKVTLSNLMVKIEAPGFDTVSTESTVYFGKFNPSDSNYYDGVIIPKEVGLQDDSVVITFEDDATEVHELSWDFQVNVEEPFFPGEDDFMFEDFDRPGGMGASGGIGGIFSNKFVWIGVVAAVAVIAGGGVFLHRRKKQKGMDFDE